MVQLNFDMSKEDDVKMLFSMLPEGFNYIAEDELRNFEQAGICCYDVKPVWSIKEKIWKTPEGDYRCLNVLSITFPESMAYADRIVERPESVEDYIGKLGWGADDEETFKSKPIPVVLKKIENGRYFSTSYTNPLKFFRPMTAKELANMTPAFKDKGENNGDK